MRDEIKLLATVPGPDTRGSYIAAAAWSTDS